MIHVRAAVISVLVAFINVTERSSKPVLDLFGSSLFILSIKMSSMHSYACQLESL